MWLRVSNRIELSSKIISIVLEASCSYSDAITLEDPLPGPKISTYVDGSRGDFELFMDRCLPGLGLSALGDLWPDATGFVIVMCLTE